MAFVSLFLPFLVSSQNLRSGGLCSDVFLPGDAAFISEGMISCDKGKVVTSERCTASPCTKDEKETCCKDIPDDNCIIRGGHLRHDGTFLGYGFHTLTPTIEECQADCAATEGCKWFTWRNDMHEQGCWHFKDEAYDAENFGTKMGRDLGGAGPPTCIKSKKDCIKRNIAPPAEEFRRRPWYPSDPGWDSGDNLEWLRLNKTRTVDECQWRCKESVWEKPTKLNDSFHNKTNEFLKNNIDTASEWIKYEVPEKMPEQKACKWWTWNVTSTQCSLYTQEPDTTNAEPLERRGSDDVLSGPSQCEEDRPEELSTITIEAGKIYKVGTKIETSDDHGHFFRECINPAGCQITSNNSADLPTLDWPEYQLNCNCGEKIRDENFDEAGNMFSAENTDCIYGCVEKESCRSIGHFVGQSRGYCALRDRKCTGEEQVCFKRITNRWSRVNAYNVDKSCETDSDCNRFAEIPGLACLENNFANMAKECIPKKCNVTEDCPDSTLCKESKIVSYKTCRKNVGAALRKVLAETDEIIASFQDPGTDLNKIKTYMKECDKAFLNLARARAEFESVQKDNLDGLGLESLSLESVVDSIEKQEVDNFSQFDTKKKLDKCRPALRLLSCESRYYQNTELDQELYFAHDAFISPRLPKNYTRLNLARRAEVCVKMLDIVLNMKAKMKIGEESVYTRFAPKKDEL